MAMGVGDEGSGLRQFRSLRLPTGNRLEVKGDGAVIGESVCI